MKKGLLRIAVSVVLLLVFTPAAFAGWYWEAEQVSQGIPGTPEGTMVVKNYYTADAARHESEQQITIMDFNTMKVYQLDPAAKTYTELDLANMGMPGIPPEQQEQMMQQMEQFMGDMEITSTGETQTISGYPCEKYVMDMMMMKNEYWMTTEIENYEDLKAIGEKVAAQFESIPMFGQMNMIGMMKEVNGFTIKSVANMMMGGTTTTVQFIEQRDLDDDLFTIPSDYTLVQQ